MAKMYYTEKEAAAKLSVSADELAGMIQAGKLRAYQDGPKKMFKVQDVDAVAGEREQEVELSPMDTSAESISLAETDLPKPPSKEDTVITAEGISIFDDEDLEIESADPLAKTRIAPSLEDQLSIEGAGSGSGLLDLTQEGDDTSLGDVLDNIDMEGSIGAGLAAEEETPSYTPPESVVVEAASAELLDASSGLFGGIIVGCSIVTGVLGIVVLAAARQMSPAFVESMQNNAAMVLLGAVIVIGLCAAMGMMFGKSMAARRAVTH